MPVLFNLSWLAGRKHYMHGSYMAAANIHYIAAESMLSLSVYAMKFSILFLLRILIVHHAMITIVLFIFTKHMLRWLDTVLVN